MGPFILHGLLVCPFDLECPLHKLICGQGHMKIKPLTNVILVHGVTRRNGVLNLTTFNKDNYVPHRRGGGHIIFDADPVGVGVSVIVSVGVTLSCLHDIS